MRCPLFTAQLCTSCTLMGQPYATQLADKQQHAAAALAGHDDVTWLEPVAGSEDGFRNKAKLVVTGTVDAPTLGILGGDHRGVDLRTCGLYGDVLARSFDTLAAFITRAAVVPYDVPRRAGELKNLLVTVSPDGELMIRFVLRSQESVSRLRKHLPWLLAELPNAVVVSVNLLPEHKAVVEGDTEIVLTEQQTLPMRLNGLTMHLRPQSFFQTNTDVAAALYRQAAAWVGELRPSAVWDLYCGVGGFALHCAGTAAERGGASAPGLTPASGVTSVPGETTPRWSPSRILGIETSAEAVASARQSAAEAGLAGLTFVAGDATAAAIGSDPAAAPDLVIVNPPRRGIGDELASWLDGSDVRHVIYSSCHSGSLARDLAAMSSFRVRRAQLLDMFPQTSHYELLTLLERR